jgi:DNA-binding winged helix-turn-helix (wHTH) protein/TolB-like protein/tetratricopeptide (TPR) repeat protein
MYESTQQAIWGHSIDLAEVADFELGSLSVRPARCEVGRNGASQTLQRRVMQVLVALADAHGAVVSQDELIKRCWSGLSVSDDAIYRCISKLRKLAADYPEPPFAIEAIPGVGYRLTSAGSVEDDQSVEAAEVRRRHSDTWRLAAAAALIVSAVAAASFWVVHGPAPDRQPVRVAVQSFEVLSDSPEAKSLARRIPNEVVDALGDSQIQTVLAGEQAVTSTPRSQAPGLIVTGMVRDDGRSVVADVRLEDGGSRTALWSAEFKRDSREASDLPLEVAARLADVVNITNFVRTANPPLTDNSALTPLLQTTDMIRDTRDGAWAPMIESAKGVVARHPDFAFGHSVLAAAYGEAAYSIDVPQRARAMSEAARREANLTLKLDPADAGAYAVLSGLVPRGDYRAQEAILLRGIQYAKHPKEPLGGLYSYEGTLLSNVGRLREALSYQLIAQATDRWGAPKAAKVALTYANIGNLPVARDWIDKAVQRWPNHSAVRLYRLYIAGFYERPADALAVINSAESQAPNDDDIAIWRSFVEARLAHSPQTNAATVAKIREAADQGIISRDIEILMLAELGGAKQAIDTANLALDHQQKLEPRFLFTPAARNIRQDPGFVGLAGRMGLIKYWRDTGKRPDFCTGQASRDECSTQLLGALK